jgi:Spy/CpxP family protein refolding chaperone
MKRLLITAAVVSALIAGPVLAQQGMGPGMMGGYGPQGMGHGMMGGHGYGPQAMGPGMMGSCGYGPQAMGPGMMGGYGSQGMAPGMMGGYGPQGMGPGMMGGYGPYAGLKLSNEQRAKIAEIQQDTWHRQWELMGKMHDQDFHMHQLFGPGKSDEAAARQAYQAMAAAHQQMFEATLEARKRIDALLSKEQREQLQRNTCCS